MTATKVVDGWRACGVTRARYGCAGYIGTPWVVGEPSELVLESQRGRTTDSLQRLVFQAGVVQALGNLRDAEIITM